MAKILHYLIHPAQHHSHANMTMWTAAAQVEDITRVDLYAEYPRFNINVEQEQQRLVDHDVIVFQFPVFWYAAPALLKEWTDLVFEQGFAFGPEGDKLAGKKMLLAMTTAGSEHAYSKDGYQNHELRSFFLPYEQTATLAQMEFVTPFNFYDAVRKDAAEAGASFAKLLTAMSDDTFDYAAAKAVPVLTVNTLSPLIGG